MKNLVIIVPGIGGSVLADRRGRAIWGDSLPGIAQSALDAERLSLDAEAVPVGLLRTMRVLPWIKVAGYDGLVRRIVRAFGLAPDQVEVARSGVPPVPGAQVMCFPYDFRLGMEFNAEQLAEAVAARIPESATRKVVVVAHSMGGLVARWWLAALGGHRVCRALITVGTPHRGAPKAVDWVVNGVKLGPGPIGAVSGRLLRGATEVVREWPSTYELFPRYPAIWADARAQYPSELVGAPDWFAPRAERGFQVHRDLETAIERLATSDAEHHGRNGGGPVTLAFFSRGHATTARGSMVNGRLLTERVDAEWLPNAGWRGDGTVPAISAIPIEASDGETAFLYRRELPDTHLPMMQSQAVVETLRDLEGESLAAVRGDDVGDGQPPKVCFDTDDIVAAGDVARVSVWLSGAEPTAGATATLRLHPVGQPEVVPTEVDMVDADEGWRSDIPGLLPGNYRVSVTVADPAGGLRVTGEDAFGVLEA